MGLEGLIGKRRGSQYEPGRRSGAWIKLKLHQEQEFVIGGYTPPEGSCKYFGALLVGYYGQAGLLFAGMVGTGFDNPEATASGFDAAGERLDEIAAGKTEGDHSR
jgi:bifunctional non-homologous end joining protein LigD